MHEVREFAGHADIRTTEVYFIRKEEDAEVALHGFNRALKRTIDVAVSAAALLAALPVMALVALAVKLDSRGPVLFKQRRSGRSICCWLSLRRFLPRSASRAPKHRAWRTGWVSAPAPSAWAAHCYQPPFA